MSVIAISGKIGAGKDEVGKIIQYLTRYKMGDNWSTETIHWDDYKSISRSIPNPDWEHVWNFKVKKFAEVLKKIVCLLIGCEREDLENIDFKNTVLDEEWWYYKRNNKLYNYSDYDTRVEDGSDFKSELIKTTPRLLLQLIGTDCGRDIVHPNIWVNALMSQYEKEMKLVPNDKYWRFGNGYCLAGDNKTQIEIPEEDLNKEYPNWIITDMRFPNELQAVKKRDGITIRVNRSVAIFEEPADDEHKPKYIIGFDPYKPEHESETALDTAEFDYVINNNGSIEELIEKVKYILTKENLL